MNLKEELRIFIKKLGRRFIKYALLVYFSSHTDSNIMSDEANQEINHESLYIEI